MQRVVKLVFYIGDTDKESVDEVVYFIFWFTVRVASTYFKIELTDLT